MPEPGETLATGAPSWLDSSGWGPGSQGPTRGVAGITHRSPPLGHGGPSEICWYTGMMHCWSIDLD